MDPEFRTYYKEFQQDAKDNNVEVDFSLSLTYFATKLNENTAAYCNSNKHVVVSEEVWDTLNPDERKVLIYHEWGHCILKRDHTESYVIAISCPDSIMYPTIEYSKDCYPILKKWYIMELFTNPRNAPLLEY